MKIRKFLVTVAALFVMSSTAFAFTAADGKVKEPGKDAVIFIGKVVTKNPVDIEARRAAFTAKAYNRSDFYWNPKDTTEFGYRFGKNDSFTFKTYQAGSFGEYFITEVKIKDKNNYTLPEFYGKMFKCMFNIPVELKTSIPVEAKYVYLGTLEIDFDYALRIKGVRHFDEYKEAQKEINRVTGKNAELYRAAISVNQKK